MGKLLILVMFLAAPAAFAQHGSMKDMDRKGMEKKEAQSVHKATGVVTRVDAASNKVTIKHDPVQSLNWPTMTMAFAVKDKALMQKMAKDKKVEFEFVQQGNEFVVTSVK
jgi:Cu(I)/Ag(I) efflux system protein CusF